MASAPAFVMPELVIVPLQLLIHRRLGELVGLIELGHDRADRFGEFFIVKIDEIVELPVEAGHQTRGMAVAAKNRRLGTRRDVSSNFFLGPIDGDHRAC